MMNFIVAVLFVFSIYYPLFDAVSISSKADGIPLSVDAPISISASANFSSGQEVSVTGIFHVLWQDTVKENRKESKPLYYLITKQDEWFRLEIASSVILPSGGITRLNGNKVYIKGKGIVFPARNNNILSEPVIQVRSIRYEDTEINAGTRGLLNLSPLAGSKKWVTILCRFADSSNDTPESPGYFKQLFGNEFPGLSHYWNEISYGSFSFEVERVAGWYDLPYPELAYVSSSGTNSIQKLVTECAAAADLYLKFTDYDGIIMVFNRKLQNYAFAGTATLNLDAQKKSYRIAVIPRTAIHEQRIWVQEINNAFGFPQVSSSDKALDSLWNSAGTQTCRRPESDYGCPAIHPVRYLKDRAGWIKPAQKFVAHEGIEQKILLDGSGLLSANTNYLLAQIPVKGSADNYYFIEARRFAEYDENIPREGVIIYKVDEKRARIEIVDNPDNSDAIFLPGQKFIDAAHGITIQINTATSSGYKVTINPGSKEASAAPVKSTSITGIRNNASDVEPTVLRKNQVLSDTIISNGTFSVQDRIMCQRAIEEVYWSHCVVSGNRKQSVPSFDEVMPELLLQNKVDDYVRKSNALKQFWQSPITSQQLQAEMDRMARNTQRPVVLQELWSALGNKPVLIAECLVRPILANRLIRNWYAFDGKFHGVTKADARSALSLHRTVTEMKQLGGIYYELDIDADQVKKINLPEAGSLSSLQEDAERFYVKAVLKKSLRKARIAVVQWQKISFDAWWQNAKKEVSGVLDVPMYNYRLPPFANTVCTIDTWASMKGPLVEERSGHSAVWTGAEMIIWGGHAGDVYFNNGGRYDPGTDTWTTISTLNAPSERYDHAAVWTGSEMIIWGGRSKNSYLNDGGRYDPGNDTWQTINNANSPDGRINFTTVWTNEEMIIWGGENSNKQNINTGGRYRPSTDAWTATTTDGAPGPRSLHTAVWTGMEMIVWGGTAGNSGGRYDPAANTWIATNTEGAPAERFEHSAVWTGNDMIIWGGRWCEQENCFGYMDGSRYNPATDSWVPVTTDNAPSERLRPSAIWTGAEMIIWGGNSYSGSRYDPFSDIWVDMSTVNAPSGTVDDSAIWTGTEMIIWGGMTNTGSRYNPATNAWIPMSIPAEPGVPAARRGETVVWTGNEMIIWGGQYLGYFSTGSRYQPATDTWTPTSMTNVPFERSYHTAVWTGTEMIVWGGNYNITLFNTGGRYNPITDAWSPTTISTAPVARVGHSAVWTGTEMIIWGGCEKSFPCFYTKSGARYNPASNRWIPVSTGNAPMGRMNHTAVWTGTEMIVWGGVPADGSAPTNTGGRYSPLSNSWIATNQNSAPSGRVSHTAVWTDSEMIIWGGASSSGPSNTGGRYNPVSGIWTSVSTANAPDSRSGHSAIWTGNEMIVWGGYNVDFINTGANYNPLVDAWSPTSTINAPAPRANHVSVWTGTEMIVWGGLTSSGGRYCAFEPVNCNPAFLPFMLRISDCKISAFDTSAQPITLSCTGLPAGATCHFSNNAVTPPIDAPISVTLTVLLNNNVPEGLYPFQVVGSNGTIIYAFDMILKVVN